MKKKICIAIPCYGGLIHAGCASSLLQLQLECKHANIDITIKFLTNQSLIPRARSMMASEAVREGCYTHLMFIDADIQFQVEDIFRMLETDVDILGGIYPIKSINWNNIDVTASNNVNAAAVSDFVITTLDDNGCKIEFDHPVEVKYVGTGLMLIKMDVFHKMMNSYPNDYAYIMEDGQCSFRFFDCGINEHGIYLSEDFWFCDRWRKLGGKVYAALWTRTKHWGMYAYEGDLYNKMVATKIKTS